MFKHIASNVREGIDDYILCEECKEYLVSKNNDPKNIWPVFIWNLLSGGHLSQFHGERNFYDVYGGRYVWSIIHRTIFPWWIDSIKTILENNCPYADVSLNNLPSIFERQNCWRKEI